MNVDPQWVSVGVLAVLAIITLYYACEVRLTRKAVNRPSLSVTTDEPTFSGKVSRLAIVNSGGVARDIEIDISTNDTEGKLFYSPALNFGHYIWLDFNISGIQERRGRVLIELRFRDSSGSIHRDSLGLDFSKLQVEHRALAFETSNIKIQQLI